MRKHLINFFSVFVFTGLVSATAFVQAQTRPYRVTDRQILTTLTRIETNTDIYKQQANNALRRGVLSSGDSEEAFTGYLTDFESAVANLSQNFDARRSTVADVEDVLNRAAEINNFMQRNRLTANAQRIWTTYPN
jgi:CHASE3 domain sensor protein